MNHNQALDHEYDLASLREVTPRGHGFSLLVTPRYEHHYARRDYEPFSADLLGAVLRRAGLFVDIGAHYVFFTALAATRYPELEVLALEPVPENFAVLSRNMTRLSLARVRAEEAAAADTEGSASFHVAAASDSCSFHPHPNAPSLRQIEVKTLPLDALLAGRAPCPVVVKMDTDGHELAVLRGMAATLKSWPDVTLLVEFNPKMQRAAGHEPETLLRALDDLGFACFLLDDERRLPCRLTPTTDWTRLMRPEGYANLYCVRKDRALSVCCFAHDAFPSGASRTLLELVTELVADHGALCTVVIPGPGPLGKALCQAGAAVLAAPLARWCDSPPHRPGPDAIRQLAPSATTLCRELLPLLERVAPDVVFTQTLVQPWGAATAALLGKPHVWSVCEYGEADHGLRFYRPFAEVIEDVAAGADLIFVNSRHLGRALFPELDDRRLRLLSRHVAIPPASASQASWFRRPDATRLGLFATVQEGKGQTDALAAVAQLVARSRNVELLLAGPAARDTREALERSIETHGLRDHARYVGFLEDPFPAMREADIHLQCSRQEAFGRAALEAMLLGKPLVYASAGGFLEFLEDGRTGLAYPPGDPTALVSRIERLLDEPGLAAALGEAAREEAGRRFTADQFGGACFRALLELRGRAPLTGRMPRALQPLFGALDTEVFQALDQRSAEAAQYAACLSTTRQELDAARQARAAAAEELKTAQTAHAATQSGLAQARTALAKVEASLAATRGAQATAHRELAARQSELEALEARCQQLAQEVERVRQAETAAQARAEALRSALHESQAELTALTSSASWRLTRPFRRWKRSFEKRRDRLKGALERGPRRDPHALEIEFIRASGRFDPAYYLRESPDVAAAGLDPIWHFVHAGARELRNPAPAFNTADYVSRHPELRKLKLNPFVHWLQHTEPAPPAPGSPSPQPAESSASAAPARAAVSVVLPERETLAPMPRVLAWYLPQFHPVPENDAWWGAGFTEWRNVTRARPLFPGHHQPQLPADLGFYDLRVPEVRQQQADLARRYGIHGFAYHYYWFNGRKVLDQPIESVLRSGEPDFPFCVSWANENWTRRWDGLESEILLRQEHSLASDVEFFRDVLPLLKDRRYITCEGRPLLIVYRPDLLRDPAETAAAWRDEALRAGLPGLHLCAVRFRAHDPRPLGFDALIEFPPHYFSAPPLDPRTLGAEAEFRGKVHDFVAGVREAITPAPKDFPYYRGAMPGWDNTARRQLEASIFHGATPELYQYWLHHLLVEARHTARSEDHFVFINAWNEWAEGTHLEPDTTRGLAWLEATHHAITAAAADGRALPAPPPALESVSSPAPTAPVVIETRGPDIKIPWRIPKRGPSANGARRKVLCVSHDAARAGAQLVLLRLVERLTRDHELEPWVLLRHGGVLEDEFRRLAPTLRVEEVGGGRIPFADALEHIIRDFRRHAPLVAVCNTVVSSDAAAVCDAHGIPVLAHVHELPTSIDGSLGHENIERVRRHARRILVVSDFVRDALIRAYELPPEQVLVLRNGIPEAPPSNNGNGKVRRAVRREFAWAEDAFLVLGCGSIHPRKGTDLFAQLALEAARRPGGERLRFLWVGHDQDGPALRQWCAHDLEAAGLAERVRFAGERADVAPYFAAADAFALTSREDPFPTVNLEAMAAGLPVVAFAGAGGAVEAFGADAGVAVPYLNVPAMSAALLRLAGDPAQAAALGARARQRIAEVHTYEGYFQSFRGLVLREFAAPGDT